MLREVGELIEIVDTSWFKIWKIGKVLWSVTFHVIKSKDLQFQNVTPIYYFIVI